MHSCQILPLSRWIAEVGDEEDGVPNEDGITWREFALVSLTLLLDMERSPDGLSSYRKRKDKCQYYASYSFLELINSVLVYTIDIKMLIYR